jgi:hypothetical protein
LSLSLRSIRFGFEGGLFDVDDVVDFYRSWLSWVFYVICYRFNFSKGDYQYAFFRGLKRGDNRYGVLVCRKFERLARFGRDLVYFGYGSHGHVKSSASHVVLEYDSNLVSLPDAWLRIGVDFNRFMSHIRKLFGVVSVVRVFESHESGYPHIHVLLIFHDYVFSGYSSRRNGRLIYRVFGSDYKSLKGCWLHGFSDFELVDSFSGGVRYLSKYLVKSTSVSNAGVKGVRALAMCWVFHKRSFSVSGSLFLVSEEERSDAEQLRHDEISPNGISNLNSGGENSDVRLVKIGVDLYGISIFERVECWRLFGFCVRDTVLWDDWCMHFVSGQVLVCVLENGFDSRRSRYDVVVSEPVRVVDGLSRCLSDF